MPKLTIGEWWADATTNEIGRGAETARLEPKAMEVLMALARRPGEAVTREALMSSVWPGVIVGDEALTQCIIKLRRALGDDPRSPRYIETISKRGYRLIAPVAVSDPAGMPGQAAPRRWRRWIAAGASAAVLACAGIYASWALRPPGAPATAAAIAGDDALRGAVTVSVLPFETFGDDPAKARLAAGIRNDLSTDLARLPGLRVISVAGISARRDAAGAGRYQVSGSVQHERDALRINIRLTDARSGEQLWSQRYERPFRDLFALQSEITQRVAEQIPAAIGASERRRAAKRYTQSVEAYELFLRGQAQFLSREEDGMREARASYARAIELDPRFARAYAGLAMAYALNITRPNTTRNDAEIRRALELAQTARQIDPDIPEVHWALGFVHVRHRRHEDAIAALRRAIDLNPSYADAYALLGGIYTYLGQPEQSVSLLRTALRLNPDAGYLYYLILGRAYLFLQDYEQARINLREALSRNAADLESRLYLAAALVAEGELASAEWEAEEIRSLAPGFATRNWLESYPMTSTPQRERLLALAGRIGL